MANLAHHCVNLKCFSKLIFGSFFLSIISKLPKIKKATKSDIEILTLIIAPSIIIGLISLRQSDKKPITVVKIAKKHGLNLDLKVR